MRVAVLAGLAIIPAFAVDVTYTTTGTFASSATNVFTSTNGLTITYSEPPAIVMPSYPSNASFGTFTATGGGPTGVNSPVDTTFTLAITQTSPAGPLTETLSDTFGGAGKFMCASCSHVFYNITGGSGAGGAPVLEAANNAGNPTGQNAYTFTLGGVVYWVDQTLAIVPSTTNGGVSTIQGAIDASALPEPTFYGLTGIGLAGLFAMAIRRRRQQMVG